MKYFRENDINRIVSYLKPFKNSLDDLYIWNTDISNVKKFLIDATINLDNKTNYQKSVYLKRYFTKNKLINQPYKKDIIVWIVKDWGRIKGINADNFVSKVIDIIQDNKIIKFEGVSSISKIVALNDPNNCVMYDSRVIYSINWIIMKQRAGDLFFPMPNSRNTKLNAFDINTIINIFYQDKFSKKNVYIDKNEAYTTFNELVININDRLFNDERQKEPYHTEMLLFALADKNILADIKSSIKINIL